LLYGRIRIWSFLEGRTTCDFRTESTKWGCLCCRFLSWQQCSCTRAVLFCCCIEMSLQGAQTGSPKATCRNFSCLHFQVCIAR
jgi:hypothetical protein